MKYDIQLTEQELHLLNMAIAELPHKLAVPLIQTINRQIAEAQKNPDVQKESEQQE